MIGTKHRRISMVMVTAQLIQEV